MEELVTFHVIEAGRCSRPTLFEVAMIVEPDTRLSLRDCDQDAWRHVIGHAKQLVARHLEGAEAETA